MEFKLNVNKRESGANSKLTEMRLDTKVPGVIYGRKENISINRVCIFLLRLCVHSFFYFLFSVTGFLQSLSLVSVL